jgi:protein-S-isoprenylcysteine O-methyltransferase Ste14
MDTVRYVLGVLLVVGLPPGIVWWYVVHPMVGFWRRMGVRITMTVMGVFLAGGVGGLYMAREVLMGADLGQSPALGAMGLMLTLLGFRLAMARRKHLTNRILAGVPEVHSDADKRGVLLDKGPYAHVRHPRYVEVAVITFGYAAIANWVGPWVVAFLALPAIHAVVILEERELLERFGDAYGDYMLRVPRRYIPSWRRGSTSPPAP